jgi:hypothetical protein
MGFSFELLLDLHFDYHAEARARNVAVSVENAVTPFKG